MFWAIDASPWPHIVNLGRPGQTRTTSGRWFPVSPSAAICRQRRHSGSSGGGSRS